MKKTFLLVLICLSVSYSHGQSNIRDSVRLLIQKERTDTGKVLLLVQLANQFIDRSPDSAMVIALEALTLSKRVDFIKGEAVSLNSIGGAFSVTGNYAKAMSSYIQALKINEKIKNTYGLSRNLHNIGLMHLHQEDYRQALEYLVKAKNLTEKVSVKTGIPATLTLMGYCYYHLQVYDSARLFAQQAFDAAQLLHNYRIVSSAMSLMGDIHLQTGQTMLALEYYRLSIAYAKKDENDRFLSSSFLGAAKAFYKLAQNDSALSYAKKSMAIAAEKKFTKNILDASRFISQLFESKRLIDSAFFYQKITISTNDSLFGQQNERQLQVLSFDEKIRQQEIASAELLAKRERIHNLQYAAIVVVLIILLILFLLVSRSVIVKTKFIEFFGVLGLLALFEFINLFIHPYLAHITNHSPVLMLLVLITIGAILIPLHHRLEKRMTKIMVEKNKKIRLAAARKTIEQLENIKE